MKKIHNIAKTVTAVFVSLAISAIIVGEVALAGFAIIPVVFCTLPLWAVSNMVND